MTLSVELQAEGPIALDAAFEVGPGQILALVGHSGSGKTTVLRCIAGFWQPQHGKVVVSGQVWLDTGAGTRLPPYKREVGMVFQSYALFPHMSAAENVMSAMHRPDRPEAHRLLSLVNLPDLADRRPAQLSGGQQQRVALARALARRPRVLLLDEPFAAVDRATREKLHAEILALRAHLDMPVILVTHDLNEAQLLADCVAVIERGRIVRQGQTAAVMSDPDALRILGIREVAALLPAVVADTEEDGLTRLQTATGPLFLPGIDSPSGTRLRVRIMAHDVILSRHRPVGLSAQNILPAVVTSIRAGDGPGVMVHLAVGEDEILARITRRAASDLAFAPGDRAHVILKSMSVSRDQIARDL